MDLFVFKAGIQSTVTRDSHVHIERQSETKHTTVEVYQKKEHGKESKMDKNNVSSSNKPEKEQKQLKNLHTHVLLILKFSRR